MKEGEFSQYRNDIRERTSYHHNLIEGAPSTSFCLRGSGRERERNRSERCIGKPLNVPSISAALTESTKDENSEGGSNFQTRT